MFLKDKNQKNCFGTNGNSGETIQSHQRAKLRVDYIW